MTLTDVGATRRLILDCFTKLRQNLRRKFRFTAAWVVECNDQGRAGHQHHIHAAVHGSLPDEATLSEKAQGVGFGRRVELAPVQSLEAWSNYLFTQVRHGDLEHHLDVNGQRLFNAPPAFWRLDGLHVPGGMDKVLSTIDERRRYARA